jgi:hypothetical protein
VAGGLLYYVCMRGAIFCSLSSYMAFTRVHCSTTLNDRVLLELTMRYNNYN